MANGDFGGTLDVSTFWSPFLAFFTAFFSFFACFRSCFVFLDIRCGPPTGRYGSVDLWAYEFKQTLALYGIVSGRSLRARMRARSHSMTSRPGYWEYPAALDGSSYGEVVVPIDDFLLAGAFAALFEQLDGIFPFGFQRNASY